MAQSNKKQLILNVAVEIMSRKGIDSTIAEIAAASGVTDSVLYHYFKNKEDLLFHAAGEHLKTGIQDLHKHLSGIGTPSGRLRKFIWFQLFYHDTNPQYANFTIFECRSKKNFFRHEAFEHFRQWTRVLRGIMEDGQKECEFPKDLNIVVARDMILGLLDMENIQFFTGLQEREARDDLDEILDLLHPILTAHPQKRNEKMGRILFAAEDIFARKGYDRATVAEIARVAQVAEGTIYEYFRNKEDLLYSVMQFHFGNYLHSLDELFSVKTPLQKLERFIRYHFSIYLNQPSFAKTFILNGIFNRGFYKSAVYADFMKYLHIIDQILDEGKSDGSIRAAVNNRIFRNLFVGAFSHMVLRWLFVGETTTVDKTYEINEVVDLLKKTVATVTFS